MPELLFGLLEKTAPPEHMEIFQLKQKNQTAPLSCYDKKLTLAIRFQFQIQPTNVGGIARRICQGMLLIVACLSLQMLEALGNDELGRRLGGKNPPKLSLMFKIEKMVRCEITRIVRGLQRKHEGKLNFLSTIV